MICFTKSFVYIMCIFFFCIDTDDTKLESCSYMLKGVHLLLGEPSDFGFSFAMDIFYKVNYIPVNQCKFKLQLNYRFLVTHLPFMMPNSNQ